MDEKELSIAKRKFESDMQEFISKRFEAFKDETGFNPSRIDVDVIRPETLDGCIKTFVGNVYVTITI